MNAESTVRFNVLRLKGWVFKGDQQIKKKKAWKNTRIYVKFKCDKYGISNLWVSKGWTIQ